MHLLQCRQMILDLETIFNFEAHVGNGETAARLMMMTMMMMVMVTVPMVMLERRLKANLSPESVDAHGIWTVSRTS